MNLTYKINSFEKKVEKPAPSTSNLLGMIKNLQKNQTIEPIVPSAPPLLNNEQFAPSAAPQFLVNPSAPPENN